MVKKINEEKFFADYELALKAKEDFVANKELAIETEKQKVDAVVSANGYSEVIKEKLIALVVEEKEKEFDLGDIDSKIEKFENYLIEVEEEIENTEIEENSENENEEDSKNEEEQFETETEINPII
ncbi:MAG: hypothetical protein M0R51_08595 [Clostridia bacterium]|jgi:hypothetical protein|nr:hypothetical protein [Clostridia bacterium]